MHAVRKHIFKEFQGLIISCCWWSNKVTVKSVLQPIGPPSQSLSWFPSGIKWSGVIQLHPVWEYIARLPKIFLWPAKCYIALSRSYWHPLIHELNMYFSSPTISSGGVLCSSYTWFLSWVCKLFQTIDELKNTLPNKSYQGSLH